MRQNTHKKKKLSFKILTLIPLLLLLALPLKVQATAGSGGEGIEATSAATPDSKSKGSIPDAFNRNKKKDFSREQLTYNEDQFTSKFEEFTTNPLLRFTGLTPEAKTSNTLTVLYFVILAASTIFVILAGIYLVLVVLVNLNKSFSCFVRTVFCCCNDKDGKGWGVFNRLLDKQKTSAENCGAAKYRAQHLASTIGLLIATAYLHGLSVDQGLFRSNKSLQLFEKDTIEGFRSANKTWLGLKQTALLLGSLADEVTQLNSTLAYNPVIPTRLNREEQLGRIDTVYNQYKDKDVRSCRGGGLRAIPDFIRDLKPRKLLGNFDHQLELAVLSQNSQVDQLEELRDQVFAPLNTLVASPTKLVSLSNSLKALQQTVLDTIEIVDGAKAPFNRIVNGLFSAEADKLFIAFEISSAVLIMVLILTFLSTCMDLDDAKRSHSQFRSCFLSFVKNTLVILLLLTSVLMGIFAILKLLLAKQAVSGCTKAYKPSRSTISTAPSSTTRRSSLSSTPVPRTEPPHSISPI